MKDLVGRGAETSPKRSLAFFRLGNLDCAIFSQLILEQSLTLASTIFECYSTEARFDVGASLVGRQKANKSHTD